MAAVVVSHHFLKRSIGSYGAGQIFDAHARFTTAGIVAAGAGAAVCWLFGGYDDGGYLWQSKLNAVVVLAVGGVVMAAVYAGMLRLLRATELSQLTGSLLSLLADGPAHRERKESSAAGQSPALHDRLRRSWAGKSRPEQS